ncbi:LysR family transcriptional regulator [Halomonas sp. I5-271120]|uniref:helix-turn-helix domain-containing protein n=1 Tax=Halomonas sp. I5-271120 TaxID=3061632 RepID=UPI0027154887|nr:LysR family transcriptional regulator [Halomonas sp. I5-271120]
MHPATFDILADSLGMSGLGRDAAHDVLTGEVGTLTAAARRHGISRPAVARQVRRIQETTDAGEVEVSLSLSVGELDALVRQREDAQWPPAPAPSALVDRAKSLLDAQLTVQRAPTKAIAFYGRENALEIILERRLTSAIHLRTLLPPPQHPEIFILNGGASHAALPRSAGVIAEQAHWHLKLDSLEALQRFVASVTKAP